MNKKIIEKAVQLNVADVINRIIKANNLWVDGLGTHEDQSEIVRNAIETPDGTVLDSLHQHDFRTYIDENGETYMVDGGTTYIRRSKNVIQAKSLIVNSDDDFEVVRQWLRWGTYGINGDQPLHYVKLRDMQEGHINAVLQLNVSNERARLLIKELAYRKN